jgi:HNH endonuclease
VTAEIPLIGIHSGGRSALVDASDVAFLSQFKWFVSVQGYPSARVNKQTVTMHRLLLGENGRLSVDHFNRNKLDNRRANLRWVTCAANIANTGVRRNCVSGFKGVRQARKGGMWHAQIRVRGRGQFLGAFTSPEQAAQAFSAAHLALYGSLPLGY